MNLLLDTHTLIWSLSAPTKLPRSVRSTIENSSNLIDVSTASTWEIAIKAAIGKLDANLSKLVSEVVKIG